MKKALALAVLSLLLATVALAHGGHQHSYLGTVKMLHENHLMVTTTDGKEVAFTLTDATTYTRGEAAATKADLKEGVRVSVGVANDGKTAKAIKIAPAK